MVWSPSVVKIVILSANVTIASPIRFRIAFSVAISPFRSYDVYLGGLDMGWLSFGTSSSEIYRARCLIPVLTDMKGLLR